AVERGLVCRCHRIFSAEIGATGLSLRFERVAHGTSISYDNDKPRSTACVLLIFYHELPRGNECMKFHSRVSQEKKVHFQGFLRHLKVDPCQVRTQFFLLIQV
ncbi:hypothetical protein Tco_1257215, partial [Tanacetum coccineum]